MYPGRFKKIHRPDYIDVANLIRVIGRDHLPRYATAMCYSIERVLRKYPMQQMCIANIADNLLKIDVIARRIDVDADHLVPLTHKTGRKQTAQTSARASD